MLLSVDLGHSCLCGFPPGQKYHTMVSHAIHEVDRFLSETLPSLVRVTRWLMRPNREGRVEHQNAPVSPRGEQSPLFWGQLKVRVLILNFLVDIGQ